jgi:large subunit ribosomal protein L5
MARLKERYKKEIVPELKKKFSLANDQEVPALEKVVVNVGLGEIAKDTKLRDAVLADVSMITGQRPVLTKAKQAISNFNIRAGDVIGCKVTLRRERMYEFLDRLINIAIPRIRDFRGISAKSFDGYGNFTMGIEEQIIFPEVSYEKVMRLVGLNITIVTSTDNDERCYELLKSFGMPFRSDEGATAWQKSA